MKAWNYFRFRIMRYPNNDLQWWLEILVLDRIIRDVLVQRMDFTWRIHIRYNTEKYGHQMSFLCYADDKLAKQINKQIKGNKFMKLLRDEELIRFIWDEESEEIDKKVKFEDTSDKDWPIELQKAWPLFIMGTSEMFLKLIEQVKQEIDQDEPPSNATKNLLLYEQYYSTVNERIIEIWFQFGSHAFFHHVNALFGYEPLKIIPRSFSGFIGTV